LKKIEKNYKKKKIWKKPKDIYVEYIKLDLFP